MRKVAPVSPGEMLDEEFLKPLSLTNIAWLKILACPLNALVTSCQASAQLRRIPTYGCAALWAERWLVAAWSSKLRNCALKDCIIYKICLATDSDFVQQICTLIKRPTMIIKRSDKSRIESSARCSHVPDFTEYMQVVFDEVCITVPRGGGAYP
jgi:hypothetical protein